MNGTLRCVGLGPGDPELITRKAERLIRAAMVIAYPSPAGGTSFARSIASELLRPDVVEIPIEVPMQIERFAALDAYDAGASEISSHLDNGNDVVVLCQGDPFFYGSFIYLFERIDRRFDIEVVPGVTSMTACAAAALQPLCGRQEELTILPAMLSRTEFSDRLVSPNPFVIIKVGRHIAKVKEVLHRLGRIDEAVYVSHASLPHQNALPLRDAPEPAPYFSTVIVPGKNLLAVT